MQTKLTNCEFNSSFPRVKLTIVMPNVKLVAVIKRPRKNNKEYNKDL